MIHVMLLDRERPAPLVFAVGHGADKVQALLNLWRTLKQNGAVAEAIDYVAAEYTRRTGQPPENRPPDEEVEFHRYSGLGQAPVLALVQVRKNGSNAPSDSGRSPSNRPDNGPGLCPSATLERRRARVIPCVRGMKPDVQRLPRSVRDCYHLSRMKC